MLRGRCRNCKKSISWRYPAIELGTAALFLLSFLTFGLTVDGIGMDIFCFLLLGLAAMDAETMTLPDMFTLPGIALGILYAGMTEGLHGATYSALWAILAPLFILAIRGLYSVLRHREGMGLGDAKLMAMIAAWLGPGLAALALFIGVVCAAIYGLTRIASQNRFKSAMALRLPLGSFLCAGAIYAIFEGEQTLKWYMQFLR